MHKTINGKQFDLGALYVTPWHITEWKSFAQAGIVLPDGSIVVLLDIEPNSDNKYSDYKLRLLTIHGDLVEIFCTAAALDYWKTLEQKKKNKKF